MKQLETYKDTYPAIVGPCRLSYMKVYKPVPNNLDSTKPDQYEVTLLFPKDPCPQAPNILEEIREVKSLVADVAKEFFDNKVPKGAKTPFKDGDLEMNREGVAKHPGYWFLKVSCLKPPALKDGSKNDVTESDGWVSGDWANAKIVFAGYNKTVNFGVSAQLRGLQFIIKDEPFGKGGSDGDDFEEQPVKRITSEGIEVDPNYNGFEDDDPFA